MPPRRENPPNSGFTKPLSFEPKSSAGYLQTFCRNCDRKIEEHGSFWVIHFGSVRTCPEWALEERSNNAAAQHKYEQELQRQERENCAPTKTAANMPRRDAPYQYAVEAEFQGVADNSPRRHTSAPPIHTPFGTEVSYVDRDSGYSFPEGIPTNTLTPDRAARSKRAMNPQTQGHLVGSGAIPVRSNHESSHATGTEAPVVDDACYHTNPAVMGTRRHQGKRMVSQDEVFSGANRHHNDSRGASFIFGDRR